MTDTILWLNIHTTGLDPKRDRILELSALHTDLKGEPLGKLLHTYGELKHVGLIRSKKVYAAHVKNGLIGDLNRRQNELDEHGWAQAAPFDTLNQFLHQECSVRPSVLAGFTPHFEKTFIHEHSFFKLPHTHLDLKGFQLLARDPDLFFPRNIQYRAQENLERSLKTYKNLLEHGLDMKPELFL